MDWNKTNTLLIIAFIIVNLFLFSVVVNNSFSDERLTVIDDKFISDVKSILLQKNITVHCDIPSTIYVEPFLEVEYQIYYPREELVKRFLSDYDGVVDENTFIYYKDDKTFEIRDGKKLIYKKEQDEKAERPSTEEVDALVDKLARVNDVDLTQYQKSVSFGKNFAKVILNQTYKGIGIANAYIVMYIDDSGLYGFEMQKIINITESKVKKSVISAPEAILRLMSYNNVSGKDLASVDIWYYNPEGSNWEDVNRINSDLTWVATFDDGSTIYLTSDD